MAFPPVLYAVELPKGSDEWHTLSATNAAEVARVLTEAGYWVRPFAAVVTMMEDTGKRKYIRAATEESGHAYEREAQAAVRGFLTKWAADHA